MSIAEENKKYLRQSMNLSLLVASGTSAINYQAFCANTYFYGDIVHFLQTATVMDLSGGGFKNDGKAIPLSDYPPENMKFGAYSQTACDADGNLEEPIYINFTADSPEDKRFETTIVLSNGRGNKEFVRKAIQWEGSEGWTEIDGYLPNARVVVELIVFGELFDFNNSNIISATLQLRGSNLDIENPSLEASEIEAQVKIDKGRIESWERLARTVSDGLPMAFSCGYEDDMTRPRLFFIRDIAYDPLTATSTIQGGDATYGYYDEQETQGIYTETTVAEARNEIAMEALGLTPIIADIEVLGEAPIGTSTARAGIWLDKGKHRDIIATMLAIYRTDALNIVYRDAGIPQLILGGDISQYIDTWELSEEEICELKIEPIKDIGEIDATLYSASIATAYGEVANIKDAKNGEVYFIDSQVPIYDVRTSGASLITPYKIKYTATADGDISIEGRIINISQSAYYTDMKIDTGEGRTIALDPFPQVPYEDGSTTEHSLEVVGSGSRSKHSFKWRGNPHMQPQDTIRLTRTSDTGTYPDNLMYPGNSLYPGGTARVVTLRILTVSYQFENGGLISEITALEVDDVART